MNNLQGLLNRELRYNLFSSLSAEVRNLLPTFCWTENFQEVEESGQVTIGESKCAHLWITGLDPHCRSGLPATHRDESAHARSGSSEGASSLELELRRKFDEFGKVEDVVV